MPSAVMGNWGSLIFSVEDFEHLDGRYGDTGTGAEDRCHACLVKEVVVLCGYHTAGGDDDVLAAEFFKLFDNLRYESLVTCRKR